MISLNQLWRLGSYGLFMGIAFLILRSPMAAAILILIYMFASHCVPFQKNWRYLPMIFLGINTYFGSTYVFGVQIKIIVMLLMIVLYGMDCLQSQQLDYSFLKYCPTFFGFILVILFRGYLDHYNFTIINTSYNAVMVWVILSTIRSKKEILDLFDMLVISTWAIVLVGLLELAIQDTFYYKLWALENRYRNGIMRMGSTVSDPNFMCFVLSPCLGILFYMRQIRTEKFLYMFSLMAFCVVIVLTQSRTGLLTMLAIGFVFIYTKIYQWTKNNSMYRWLSYIIIFCCGLTGVLILLPSLTLNMSDDSFSGRFYVILATFEIVARHPILGLGFGKYITEIAPILQTKYDITSLIGFQNPMNTLLQITVDIGLFGLLLYSFMWWNGIRQLIAIQKQSWEYKTLTFWILISAGIWFFFSMTLDGMGEQFMWILLIIPSILIKIVRLERYD